MSGKKESISGIYRIFCLITGKSYYGSTVDFEVRWKEHRRKLRKNRHHCIRLQHAWNKYGEENFGFEMVQIVPLTPYQRKHERRNILLPIEQKWLDETKCYDKDIGYNSSKIASSSGPFRGSKTTKLDWEKVREIRNAATDSENRPSLYFMAKKYGVCHTNIYAIIRNKTWYDDEYVPPDIIEVDILSKEQVYALRNDYSSGKITNRKELAAKYGILYGHVSSILLNKVYFDPGYLPPKKNKSNLLTGQQFKEIIELHKQGIGMRPIAKQYGVSRSYVQYIIHGKSNHKLEE